MKKLTKKKVFHKKRKFRKYSKIKGGVNQSDDKKCVKIGNDPLLSKCKSVKADGEPIYSYMYSGKKLAMAWKQNVEELKQLFLDLEHDEISLTNLGNNFFSNNIEFRDSGKRDYIHAYYINDYIRSRYGNLVYNFNYNGTLFEFIRTLNSNFAEKQLYLFLPEDKELIPNNVPMIRRRFYLSDKNKKHTYTFKELLEKNSYDKYIERFHELIDEMIKSTFITFFTKMKLHEESIINISGSMQLFYFIQLSSTTPYFHRNEFSRNRINIYIETSGYNKLDLQFTKNTNIIEPKYFKIIDTDKTNVVWWNDDEIVHRTPVGLVEDNIPRIFIFLEFNYDDYNNMRYNSDLNENNNLEARKNYIYGNQFI
jgi:hypothetical protein